jgi:hypothetical protein
VDQLLHTARVRAAAHARRCLDVHGIEGYVAALDIKADGVDGTKGYPRSISRTAPGRGKAGSHPSGNRPRYGPESTPEPTPGEGTSVRFYPLGPFTRTRPDGEVAPIPAVPAPTIGWPKSTHNGRSLRLTLSICLPLLFEIQ